MKLQSKKVFGFNQILSFRIISKIELISKWDKIDGPHLED